MTETLSRTELILKLIVEQYLDFVLGISDYMYIMEKGDIILKGSTSELDAAEVQEKMTH